jgi:Domain of unknown function (DUF4192)
MDHATCLAPSSATRPEELLGAVPYLVGYRPIDSLICLFHTDDRAITLTARLDLSLPDGAVEDVGDGVASHGRRLGPDGGVVLIGADPRRPDAMGLMRSLVDLVTDDGLRVTWAGCLVGDTWRSIECDTAGCGQHRLVGSQVSPLVAELVSQGMTVADSRERVTAEVSPDGDRRVPMPDSQEPAELEPWRDAAIDRVTLLLTTGQDLADSDVATVAAACTDIRVRDCVLWRLTRRNDRETWMAAWHVIAATLRRCPVPATADVAAVASVVAWQCGDGLRANEALDVAWRADPGQSLAGLVRRSLDAGLPPSVWHSVMDSLTEEQCRHGTRRDAA